MEKEADALLIMSNQVVSKFGETLPKKLVKCGIFSRVIIYTNPQKPNKLSMADQETFVVNYCDKILNDNGIGLSSNDTVYVVNDNFSTLFTLYFNIKQLNYIWIEIVQNLYDMGVNATFEPFPQLYNKYKPFGGLAPFAKACIITHSDKTRELLNDKVVMEWDPSKILKDSTNDTLCAIGDAFDIKNTFFDDIENSAILLKNSFGLLDWKSTNLEKNTIDFAFRSRKMYYAEMDLVALDYYAKEFDSCYIKCHVHDWIDCNEITTIYGPNAKGLPNIPMEFIEGYLRTEGKHFGKTISISTSASSGFDNVIKLGEDFIKTWSYYDQIYVALDLLKLIGRESILCSNNLVSQIALLGMPFAGAITSKNRGKKDTTYICDCLLEESFDPSCIEKGSNAILLNVDKSGSQNIITSTFFYPICCDILNNAGILLNRTMIWVYLQNRNDYDSLVNYSCIFEGKHSNRVLKAYAMPTRIVNNILMEQTRFVTLARLAEEQKRSIAILKKMVLGIEDLREILTNIGSSREYLLHLQYYKKRLLILAGTKDTPGISMPNDVLEIIRSLGLFRFEKKLWFMYAGIIASGATILDAVSSKAEENLESNISYGTHTINVVSKCWKKGNVSSIKVDDVDYSVNNRGLNIVVLNPTTLELIDSIAIDFHTTSEVFVRHS